MTKAKSKNVKSNLISDKDKAIDVTDEVSINSSEIKLTESELSDIWQAHSKSASTAMDILKSLASSNLNSDNPKTVEELVEESFKLAEELQRGVDVRYHSEILKVKMDKMNKNDNNI
jgi:hypothetical protein